LLGIVILPTDLKANQELLELRETKGLQVQRENRVLATFRALLDPLVMMELQGPQAQLDQQV
jgi:hypothetical protein